MKSAFRSTLVALALVLCTTAAFAGIRKAPYLIFEGSNTAMTVLWQTTGTESNTLRWGTDTNYTLGQATVGVYGTDFQHKYTITGLQPNTKYYYEVAGYGTGSFRTAPASSATSLKFLAYGDSRSYPASHETVASRMRSKYASDPAYQTLVLHDGDFIGSDTEADWTAQHFVSGSSYPNMRALQAEVPMIGARGNHEGTGAVYKKYFPFPYVANYYWSFDYGPVHFTVIDNYASFTSGSAQYNWLVNDLSSTTKPWKVILQHEPGWGAGTHSNNTSIQSALHPLFKQYGVDLIVNGHNHNYARALVEAKNYITTGGGGASLYTPDAGYPNIVKVDKSYHYTEVDVQDTTLTMTARRADGTVIETITVNHGSGNQPPVANAGADQSVTDSDGNGSESVTLNGAASSDSDGTISSYVWKEGTTQIATGATPAVTLAAGTTTITLTVTDNDGATATDTVIVTVQGATPPGSFSLVAPSNGKTNVSRTPSFDWSDAANAATYSIVVDVNSDFSSPEVNVAGLTSSAYTATATLGSRITYYWKVSATNANGSTTSPVFSFVTKR